MWCLRQGQLLRDTPIKQAPHWLTGIVCEEELPMTNQTFLHIDIVLKCIESGVFYCPAFFRGVTMIRQAHLYWSQWVHVSWFQSRVLVCISLHKQPRKSILWTKDCFYRCAFLTMVRIHGQVLTCNLSCFSKLCWIFFDLRDLLATKTDATDHSYHYNFLPGTHSW